MAYINVGKITEELNDLEVQVQTKVPTGHEVIEFQAPTEENSYTWYRKYADGWVEQGGTWLSASAAYNTYVVTLPVIMQNTNYYANAIISYTGSDCWGAQVSEKTISTVKFMKVYNSLGLANWEVKGMYAQ